MPMLPREVIQAGHTSNDCHGPFSTQQARILKEQGKQPGYVSQAENELSPKGTRLPKGIDSFASGIQFWT